LFVAAIVHWSLSLFFPAVSLAYTKNIPGYQCFVMATASAVGLSSSRSLGGLCLIAFFLHLALLFAGLSRLPFASLNVFRVYYVNVAIALFLIFGSLVFHWAGTYHFKAIFAGYRLWISSFQLMAFALLLSDFGHRKTMSPV
jgi:hypothetical protein